MNRFTMFVFYSFYVDFATSVLPGSLDRPMANLGSLGASGLGSGATLPRSVTTMEGGYLWV